MAASNESTADLTDSVVDRFLDAVRQHPCVYDTKRLDYRDVDRKNNAWEQIRLHAGLPTVDDCLKLWKRLRDRYTRELKAIEGSKRSGSGYVSRRTWEFAESMAFYKDCGRPRKTTCSLSAASCSSGDGDTVEDILMTTQSSRPSSPMADSFLDAALRAGASTPLLPSPLTPPVPTTAARKHLKTKQKKTDAFEEELLGQLQKKMSEDEAFGLSVGLSLDRMSRKMASKCKAKIMQVISECEEELD
ncbi:uncharacterized protein LOC144093855 [Amblyomma americanum]